MMIYLNLDTYRSRYENLGAFVIVDGKNKYLFGVQLTDLLSSYCVTSIFIFAYHPDFHRLYWRNMMTDRQSYLIIGNGIAGVTAAEILRNEDAEADITVITDDPFPVYYRPALKDYLGGKVREDKLWARPTSF